MSNVPKLAALAAVIREVLVLVIERKNEPNARLWSLAGGHTRNP